MGRSAMIVVCPSCGSTFVARTPRQAFCDLGCYLKRKGLRRLRNQAKNGKHDAGRTHDALQFDAPSPTTRTAA